MAAGASEVYLVVSGLPLQLKGSVQRSAISDQPKQNERSAASDRQSASTKLKS
jgi:hypothetical protein